MFTGIVEEVGTIKHMTQGEESLELSIEVRNITNDLNLGDSISVNGVCLTVTNFTDTTFDTDIMPETFHHTALKRLTEGSKVNLERAMHANGRFGGHFVSGHVDGVGKIMRRETKDNAEYFDIEVSPELSKYMMMKGSVSVDGTSLTIFGLSDHHFTISLIPHTQDATILTRKHVGDEVNIECDMLLKYVHRLVKPEENSDKGVSLEQLKQAGFLGE
ncbi:riboflavin synthase [Tenuibacillus multivorans]|uniref:Riboflavin synthase n=1 Tax=Tenuibacillus multivorans TaxID=237069 RepID=A0A1H0FSL7_9BACI|nr:riboflavin synthase [Tenuibacillus multivorans]GEL77903.1 riboflavin synthase [Tenuibacillus multivorans]SDN97541.1 riboflavin synthase [Tenuibacillus multivorans]